MLLLCISTLLLSVSIILAVLFTTLNSTIETDLKNDTITVCNILNNSTDTVSALKNVNTDTEDLRLTLISPDGDVIYDSDGNYADFKSHENRPEFTQAKEHGIGQSKRFSDSLSKNYYYCAKVLDNGMILRSAKTSSSALSLFYVSFIFIAVMLVIIFILSAHIASKLASGIMSPITNPEKAFQDQYDEIRPLTQKIEHQNKEIKRQIEKASHQEHQHQLITDNMNEGLVVVDKDGILLSLNKFAAKIFNVNELDVKNRHFSTLTDNELFNLTISKALESRRNDVLIEMGELDYRVFCSSVLRNGELSAVVILMFDVTSTSRSEKLRREFSANVSHELKTPLTSINGYAQLISSGIAKESDIPEFASKIAKESSRLMMLIEDIMRLSKLDENSLPAETTIFSVKENVNDIITSLSKKAQNNNITIKTVGADFFIKANKSQITELIYNIADNAIKYNNPGGSVTFVFAQNSLRISDTGIGIPSEYTERIFERFFRVDKSHSKKVDGTGLGLSIVKHIAKINNIDIDVKSEISKGTVFTINFSKILP